MVMGTTDTKSNLFERLAFARKQASDVVLSKDHEIDLAISCLIASGHLLIEDIPGVGKTILVKTLAKLFNLQYSRIQFTNDLLPGDILGSSIYDPDQKQFRFHPGPIFAQLVLADELNRATPKTQSACLQAMEERAITVDGITHALNAPFFLIATQNPRDQVGTFSLPESQLDRFLMRISLGYPSRAAEKQILLGDNRHTLVESLSPILTPQNLTELRALAANIHASDAIIEYVQNLVAYTRNRLSRSENGVGLSPRGSMSLIQAARAWALLQDRKMILPEDVQAIAVAVMSHRLNPVDDPSGQTGLNMAEETLAKVNVD